MKTYRKGDIKIGWDPSICVHAGNCARGLPEVFKPKDKPWITPQGATRDQIIEQVAQCPSKALTIIYNNHE
ncbi:MAG: (4Fe-4S)-binding protein [Balneola sp.]|nr:MAG: (4Fe-4S)-binding protein [Balneola sp.]